MLVATYLHSFPSNFLKKVILQRNQVGAAETCLLTGFFLGNRQLLHLTLVLPGSDLKLATKTVVRARRNRSLK